MIVEGQIHGGMAQGAGQALMEQVVYDAESGQLITGSLMDYCAPRAADFPPMRWTSQSSTCRSPRRRSGAHCMRELTVGISVSLLVHAVLLSYKPVEVRD